MLFLAACAALVLAVGPVQAASAGNDWSRTRAGDFQDNVFSLVKASDGGFLIGGWTDHNEQNATYSWFIENFFLWKTDRDGNQEWYRVLGDNQSSMGGYACEAPGGGYVMAGVLGSHGAGSIGLFKVDQAGQTVWEKTCRPGFDGWVKSLVAAPDGFILAGTCNRSVFLIKLDFEGNVVWDRTYDQAGLDVSRAVPTRDGGFVVTGGPIHGETGSLFLMKTDAGGNELWLKRYGNGRTCGLSVIEDSAGSLVVAGYTGTNYVGLFDEPRDSGTYVLWTDGNGEALREVTCDLTPLVDYANDIVQMDDGGYTLTGLVARNMGGWYVIDSDAYLLRLDSNGTQQWIRKFGSPGEARGVVLARCDDGSVAVAGERSNSEVLLAKVPDAPDTMAPLTESIKPIESLYYHYPQFVCCVSALFLLAFISLAYALIAIKRSLERKKKSQ